MVIMQQCNMSIIQYSIPIGFRVLQILQYFCYIAFFKYTFE